VCVYLFNVQNTSKSLGKINVGLNPDSVTELLCDLGHMTVKGAVKGGNNTCVGGLM